MLASPPSSMVTSVGEKESVGAASSLSMVMVSGSPIVTLPIAGAVAGSTMSFVRIVSVI